MALNVPSGEKKRLTFGPGILKVGVAYATPTTDVGYCRGATLTITRQKLDVFQGSPRSLIETYAVQEDVTLNFTGLEWNPANLIQALGSGVATGTAPAMETLEFGGEVTFSEVALLFSHITPTGGTVDIKIWRAQGQGEFNINFGDDMQEFQYNFRAIESLTSWENASLGTNKRLLKVEFTRAP
jgi:hypothetical protein